MAIESDTFTGSEVAALVPDALYMGFADNQRPIRTSDLVAAARATVPLSKTAAEKITKLREWAASGRARAASAPEPIAQVTRARQIDL